VLEINFSGQVLSNFPANTVEELCKSKALSLSIILNLAFFQTYSKSFQRLVSTDRDKKNVVKLLKQSPARYHKEESQKGCREIALSLVSHS